VVNTGIYPARSATRTETITRNSPAYPATSTARTGWTENTRARYGAITMTHRHATSATLKELSMRAENMAKAERMIRF
jgi:hypothetical protein